MATPSPPGPTPLLPPMYATGPIPSDPRRTRTYGAVDRIRTSITLYLIIPLLSTIYALLVTAVLLSTNAFVVGNFGGGSGFGGLVESDSAAIAIPGELIGLITLVLTIVAWITWRRGVRELAEASGEYGEAQVGAAQQARKDYSYTVYTWLATFLFGIVVAVVVIIVLLDSILHNINSGQSNATAAANALGSAVVILAVVAVISVALTVLLYHFASRSLVGAIGAVSSPTVKATLQRARSFILIGAVLGILDVGVVASRVLYALSVVGTLLVLIGFLMMRSAYSAWLAAPPPASGVPGAGYVSVGSFPPPAPGSFPSPPPPPP